VRVQSGTYGRTWGEPVLVKQIEGAAAANPEAVQLEGGRLLLFYNQRPNKDARDAGGNPLCFAIGVCRSDDGGKTWQSDANVLYQAGAPYIRQMPSEETVLSCQSNEGRRAKEQMVVYVGNANARDFREPSVPFPNASDVSGLWNALFVKDATTITAISDTAVNGVRGLWAIDGRIVHSQKTLGAP
jgi:hypothetical protein